MIACDELVEPADEVCTFVLLFIQQMNWKKVIQSFEEESLFVPCSDAILPVYVFMYTKSSSWKAKERALNIYYLINDKE